MSCTIKLVRGDTRPQVKFVVTDENTDKVVDISGSTPRLKFRAIGTTQVLFVREGQLMSGLELPDGEVDTDPPYNTPGTGGRVVFSFIAGDLDLTPGYYEGEIEITFSDDSIQTVYRSQRFFIRPDY